MNVRIWFELPSLSEQYHVILQIVNGTALARLKVPKAGRGQAGIGYIHLAELQPTVSFTLAI